MPAFSEDLFDTICNRMASGESLREICDEKDMPSQTSVFRWLAADEGLSERYARAREAQQETHLEQMFAIADGATPATVNVDRLRVDVRKWVMSKLAPKKYGDKLDVTSGGKRVSQPTIVTLRGVAHDRSDD